MRMTKKITSIVLAVLMVVSMMSVMAVSVSAAGENFEVVALGDGATGAVGDQFVDINDAMAAAGDNGSIKLITDMEFDGNSGFIFVSNKNNITFDLNGHKITSNNTSGINLSSTLPGVATFTVKDSSSPKTGEIITTVNPSYTGNACISGNTGREIVIESGKFTSDAKALYVEGKGATIKSGTFNGDIYGEAPVEIKGGTINGDVTVTGTGFYFDSGWSSHSDPSTATITGGTINGDVTQAAASNAITISGGTVNGDVVPAAGSDSVTITGGTFANDPGAYVDTSVYKVKYTNTAGKVQYKKNIDYSNVGGSGTYQLLDDLTANSRIVPALFASNVVFDLNGHTLTSTATDEAFLFSRAGSASTHNSYTIKNGTVVAAGDGVDLLAKNADLTLENVNIVANGVYGVVTNGTNTGNNITATDSSITAGTLGIYKPSNGSLTLTDTDVTGKTAVYVKSGDVSINGGTFTGTGAAADYSYNGDGANITGDAIVIDNCGYPGGAPTVSITSGTFVSENADAVGSYAYGQSSGTDREPVDSFISGGEFSSDVSDLVVAGSTANTGGTVPGAPFVIVPDTFVAQVGDTKYDTLAAAISAAQNGDTVKLLDDVTEAVSITGKTLTLDLNGYNITSPSTTQPIKAYGGTKLTIVNNNADKLDNTPTQNAVLGSNGGSNNYGSLFASGEGTEVNIYAGYYYGYNGDKTAIHAVNKATVTFYDCVVNGAAGFNGEGTSGKEGKVFYSGVGNPTQPYAMDPGYIVVHGGTFSGRMSDSNWGNYEIDGGTFDRNVVVLNENPYEDDGVTRKPTTSGNMTKIKDGTLEESNWLVEGFAPKANANGTFSVEVDTNPLNPIEKAAADISDNNAFGLNCDYLKGTLLGVQKKSDIETITSESGQEGQYNIRFVAVLDTTLLQGADDYGFVLAKVGSNKDYSNTNIENLKANWGNGEKTISAKGTYNNVCGNEAYGDPTDGSTDYKYVTCAVNNMNVDDQVLARFYYKKNGKTFYAKYAGQNYGYTGCISPADPA